LFDATTGGSTPLHNGAVARWMDKSINGFAFTQGTANNRPLRITNAIGTRSGLDFDGSNDVLYAAANVFDTNVSVFAVLKFDTTARKAAFDLNTGAGNFRHFNLEANTVGSANRLGLYASNAAYDTPHVFNTNTNIFCITANASSGNSVIENTSYRVNGKAETLTLRAGASATYADYAAAASIGVMIGGYNDAGAQAFPSANMDGRIYEIAVYNRVLSASELALLETYLSLKWGVAIV
jgi:hypothetical protein